MRIGREDRWWNRRVRLPIKPILLVVGLILVVLVGYLSLGSVTKSFVWSITHRSTAAYAGWPGTKYEGFSVKVPWMWRQEPGLGSDQSVEIIRARFGRPTSFESASIRRDVSPEKTLNGMDSIAEKLAKAGYPTVRMEAVSIDPDLVSHFFCKAMHINGRRSAMIQCGSNDGGRWLVTYNDLSNSNAGDLNAVLRNLVSAQ